MFKNLRLQPYLRKLKVAVHMKPNLSCLQLCLVNFSFFSTTTLLRFGKIRLQNMGPYSHVDLQNEEPA